MPTREETVRRFAAVMGFDLLMPWGFGWDVTALRRIEFQLPSPSAALSSHLYFVGQVAEALGLDGKFISWERYHAGDEVQFHENRALASDPSWAAMLAAIEAKESKS